jgi:hypothetical protein
MAIPERKHDVGPGTIATPLATVLAAVSITETLQPYRENDTFVA